MTFTDKKNLETKVYYTIYKMQGSSKFGAVSTKYTKTINTTDDTFTPLCVVQSQANTVSFVTTKVIAVNVGSGDSVIYKMSARVKNNGGTVTLGTEFDSWRDFDAGLEDTNIIFTTGASSFSVEVSGIDGISIDWTGYIELVTVEF